MDVNTLTRDKLREILRASEGIPSQVGEAEIKHGRVSPSPVGHPISHHLHSAGFAEERTKFLSLDDMVEALWMFVRVPTVTFALMNMKTGDRSNHREGVGRVFGIEAEVSDPQGRQTRSKVKFTPEEQRRAGLVRTNCFAAFEIRERAGEEHLQVHTFYPALEKRERLALLQSVRNHQLRQ